MPVKLVIVGGGRMGGALLGGLLAGGWPPADLAVVELAPGRREELTAAHPGLEVADHPPSAEAAVLAVKPADAEAGCRSVASSGARRLLSLAAGVTTAALEGWVGDGTAVVRAMPNVPALVGAGATALSGGGSAGAGDVEWARQLMGAVGEVVVVAEGLMDAVTGLSGSGPAYVFLVVEALIEGGVAAGLPREVAARLAVATVAGAGRLLSESGEGPEQLRAAVTSPGGTTAAGLRALEARGVRSALIEAVLAAAERSAALGR